MKHIKPINNKGEPHGYWEYYYHNDNLWYKGNFINRKQHGYWEFYLTNNELKSKEYYI
jgi:antitoxin component YwqK of YwqJK toxin-antitoxin module